MSSPPLGCPRCKRPLRGGDVPGPMECAACRLTFPCVHGLPILVDDPAAYLAGSYLALSRTRSQLVGAIAELEGLARDPSLAYRHAVFRDVASGLRLNLALLDVQRARLRDATAPYDRFTARINDAGGRVVARLGRAGRWPGLARLPTRRATGYDFDAALEYLRNDWSGTPEGAAQVGALGELLDASLARFCGPSSDAVYLGAGLGRHAFEGAKVLRSVLAVELSFAAADLMASVREGPVAYCVTNWDGPATTGDLAPHYRARLPAPAPPGLRYVVADAAVLPVPDASLDAVVSVFFTDLLPVSALLPEIARVLRPGGVFIHLGPLYYHFRGNKDRLAREEVRRVLYDVHGFEIEQDDPPFDLPYLDGPGSLRATFRVWGFVARRGGGALASATPSVDEARSRPL